MAEAGIDLVVADLELPDASGLGMMRVLSAAPGLRGIAISGAVGESDMQESAAAGFGWHLVKPIDSAMLRQAIAEVMRGA